MQDEHLFSLLHAKIACPWFFSLREQCKNIHAISYQLKSVAQLKTHLLLSALNKVDLVLRGEFFWSYRVYACLGSYAMYLSCSLLDKYGSFINSDEWFLFWREDKSIRCTFSLLHELSIKYFPSMFWIKLQASPECSSLIKVLIAYFIMIFYQRTGY